MVVTSFDINFFCPLFRRFEMTRASRFVRWHCLESLALPRYREIVGAISPSQHYSISMVMRIHIHMASALGLSFHLGDGDDLTKLPIYVSWYPPNFWPKFAWTAIKLMLYASSLLCPSLELDVGSVIFYYLLSYRHMTQQCRRIFLISWLSISVLKSVRN